MERFEADRTRSKPVRAWRLRLPPRVGGEERYQPQLGFYCLVRVAPTVRDRHRADDRVSRSLLVMPDERRGSRHQVSNGVCRARRRGGTLRACPRPVKSSQAHRKRRRSIPGRWNSSPRPVAGRWAECVAAKHVGMGVAQQRQAGGVFAGKSCGGLKRRSYQLSSRERTATHSVLRVQDAMAGCRRMPAVPKHMRKYWQVAQSADRIVRMDQRACPRRSGRETLRRDGLPYTYLLSPVAGLNGSMTGGPKIATCRPLVQSRAPGRGGSCSGGLSAVSARHC